MTPISRRGFVALTAAGVAGVPLLRPASAATLTAEQIIELIQARIPSGPGGDTVDTIKAGDPATAVTGIVTTALASMDVLKRAVGARANLVVTCEPTFYSRADRPVPPQGGRGGNPAPPDPIVAAKADFIAANRLVVWRFSDGWRRHAPDPFVRGLAGALGWTPDASGDPAHIVIPELTLERLVRRVRDRLDARGGIRVIGDPRLRLRRVALLPGTTPIQAALRAYADADVIIAGEVREWETVEFARDLSSAGQKKALVLIGRILSEGPGMDACARWLRTELPDVRVRSIPAGDPYWRPV